MICQVTPDSVVTHYKALQGAINSGGLSIEPLLSSEVNVDTAVLEELTVDDNGAIRNVFTAQEQSGCEITKCLNYISTRIPEELLSDVIRLFSSIETKDPFTAKHSARVCMYSAQIGESCNLKEDEIIALLIGSFLHDIGKLDFPDYLFHNENTLTPSELIIIRRHPEAGEEILRNEPISKVPELLVPVRSHHENINGGGYPDSLKGSRIPLLAKIVKLADCLDAMTVQRTYNTIFPIDVALQKIHDARNKEFDPDLVAILETVTEEMLKQEVSTYHRLAHE